MIEIKVLGTGCAKCKATYEVIKKVVDKNEIDAKVVKIEDFEKIMEYSIMLTPGIVVNEKIKSQGKVPVEKEILEWIREEEG